LQAEYDRSADRISERLAAANVTLDGTGSSDPDGDSLTYMWTEGGTTIGTGATPTVSLGPGTHTITLSASDRTRLS
jgi:PKD domain